MVKFLKIYKYHILFLLGSLLFYSYSLSSVPVHLNQDELMFSLNAYSISRTLKDYYGNFLPFYFWHLGSFWATPIITYMSALIVRFVPFSEASIRLTSVLVGSINISLIMVLAQKIFKDKKVSLLAGLMIAVAPVHFIHSRLLLDNLYTVPFTLVWLIFLKDYLDSAKRSKLFFVGLFLGIGLHSYHAAKIVMPIFLLISLVLVYIRAKFDLKSFGITLFGFLIPIIIFIPWLIKHPDTLLNQVSYIGSIDSSIDAQKGIIGVFSVKRMSPIVSSYFSYFSPEILFTRGDKSLIHSTENFGAFLLPVFPLFIFGLMEVFLKRKDIFSYLVFFGFLVYPVAPALVNDPQRISRGLIVIPFVSLIAAYGFHYLLKLQKRDFKILAKVLVGFLILQFLFFLHDYFGDYTRRSHTWFNEDIESAYQAIINSSQLRDVENIYLDGQIRFISYYRDFYEIQKGSNLKDKEIIFDYTKEDFSKFPQKSLVLVAANHIIGRNDWEGEFEKVEIIREPDGKESFYLFYRN